MKKTQVANAVSSDIDNASIASTIATNLIGELALETQKQELRNATNALIAKLKEANVVVGRLGKNPCAIAYAFHSTLLAGGVAKGTANNYLTTFKEHVKTGKPITDWNIQRAKQNNASGTTREKQILANKLFKVFMDKEFDEFINDLQKSYHNDEIKTLKEGIVSYLEMHGEDISKKK